ncbi:unnamed protein product [Brassica rapa subsp. narinosa]
MTMPLLFSILTTSIISTKAVLVISIGLDLEPSLSNWLII